MNKKLILLTMLPLALLASDAPTYDFSKITKALTKRGATAAQIEQIVAAIKETGSTAGPRVQALLKSLPKKNKAVDELCGELSLDFDKPFFFGISYLGTCCAEMSTKPFTARAKNKTDKYLQAAFGFADGSIRIGITATGKPNKALINGHRSAITTLEFSDDGKVLVSGDHEGRVVYWDLVKGRTFMIHHNAPIRKIALTGKTIVHTASVDGDMKITQISEKDGNLMGRTIKEMLPTIAEEPPVMLNTLQLSRSKEVKRPTVIRRSTAIVDGLVNFARNNSKEESVERKVPTRKLSDEDADLELAIKLSMQQNNKPD